MLTTTTSDTEECVSMQCQDEDKSESTTTTTTIPEYIVTSLRNLGLGGSFVSVQEAKSAQQRVWIVQFPVNAINPPSFSDWKPIIEASNCYVVIRQWRSARGWWNLNHTTQAARRLDLPTLVTNKTLHNKNTMNDDNTTTMEQLYTAARSELTGYQLAHEALPHLRIPKILFFSGNSDKDDDQTFPWAMMEYVGERRYNEEEDNDVCIDNSLIHRMVPTRHEFGFDERHPRWGRLPIAECLEYAKEVLQFVILPMHIYYYQRQTDVDKTLLAGLLSVEESGFHFMDVIDVCRHKLDGMQAYLDGKRTKDTTTNNMLLKASIKLEEALDQLTYEALSLGLDDETTSLPCVPCHMDLQPQNLLMARKKHTDDSTNKPVIRSVLDWEEAAYADPRFELLMLCRKVVANREQADEVWLFYERLTRRDLGSIEPWLKLETVHSITTLLLQACAGGGRSPWETRSDLWGKVDREFKRLVQLGWQFCSLQLL